MRTRKAEISKNWKRPSFTLNKKHQKLKDGNLLTENVQLTAKILKERKGESERADTETRTFPSKMDGTEKKNWADSPPDQILSQRGCSRRKKGEKRVLLQTPAPGKKIEKSSLLILASVLSREEKETEHVEKCFLFYLWSSIMSDGVMTFALHRQPVMIAKNTHEWVTVCSSTRAPRKTLAEDVHA
jgi:hypothetical protein